MMAGGPQPTPEEARIGLELFMTDTLPLGGRLRRAPEDFVVEEIPENPPEDPDGEYTIATVTVKNWETNRLVQAMADSLGISKRAIRFAGTKDKRAVTSQLMSFHCHPERVMDMRLKDVRLSGLYRSSTDLTIGGLYGNDFHVFVRDIRMDIGTVRSIAGQTMDRIVEIGGFPNFFGVQRFGAVRPITHIVGRFMVKRQFREAVLSYVCEPYEKEPPDQLEKRRRLQNDLDFKGALQYYPYDAMFERSMISHLIERPDDWTGAIEILPENLKMMFVHAYQSYLFNRMLSERMRRGIPLNEPIEGDLLLPMNKKRLPDRHTYVEIKASNIGEMASLVKDGKAFVSGLIIGSEATFAGGEMGEIEHRVIDSESIVPDDFNFFEVDRVSSKGIRRELLAPIFDLRWRVIEEKTDRTKKDTFGRSCSIELKFALFRGTYATSFLRELLKGPLNVY